MILEKAIFPLLGLSNQGALSAKPASLKVKLVEFFSEKAWGVTGSSRPCGRLAKVIRRQV
jgi:hypothetical protein